MADAGLNMVRKLLDDFAKRIPEMTPDDQIDALAEVRTLAGDLRLLDGELVLGLAEGHSNGDVIEERARVRWSKPGARWDREAARHAILTMEREKAITDGEFAVDPETGEKVPTWDAAEAAITKHWLLQDPRTTAMKNDLGLDPDEFRSGGTWRPSVELL